MINVRSKRHRASDVNAALRGASIGDVNQASFRPFQHMLPQRCQAAFSFTKEGSIAEKPVLSRFR